MPIYEYDCQECGEHFDKLVRSSLGNAAVTCPACHSTRCVKSLSCFCTSNSSGGASKTSATACAPSG